MGGGEHGGSERKLKNRGPPFIKHRLGVYVDIAKFFILWVHFHYYDASILQETYPTLTNE